MPDENISVDFLRREATIHVRDIEIKFWDSGKRLIIVSRMNFSGGRSTHLTNAEYNYALLKAAEKLGVKIRTRLKHAA